MGFVCAGAMRGLLPSSPSGSGWPWRVGVRVYVGTSFCVLWAGSPRVYKGGGLPCWPRPPSPTKKNIRLQQCCVVLVGVYPARPVVSWRFWCFLSGSWLGIIGRHGTVAAWAAGGCAVTPHVVVRLRATGPDPIGPRASVHVELLHRFDENAWH